MKTKNIFANLSKNVKKIAASLAAIGLLSAGMPAASAISIAETQGEQNYWLLQNIINLYLETSLYETDRETLIDDMLYNYLCRNPYMMPALANALLSTHDPYSAYYTADEAFLSSVGKSYGIVIMDSQSLDDDDPRKASDGIYISEVIPGSNAAFAGILPGDRLISLDGINVEGMTVNGVQKLLNILPLAPKELGQSTAAQRFSDENFDMRAFMAFSKLDWDGTKEVEMVFSRAVPGEADARVTFSVPKGIAENKSVYLTLDRKSRTAVIEITAFDSDHLKEQFVEAFEEAKNAGMTDLILDLRDNPGGYFDQAVALGNLFTKEAGTVMFYTNSRSDVTPKAVTADDEYIGDAFSHYIVLINGSTASAAELFAYIMQSQAGAVLIGERSYGKAVGQDVYSLENGDSFSLTSFEILTVDKSSYNVSGLVPDVEVPLAPQKFDFPELYPFGENDGTLVGMGAKNDAVLALEQRFELLGLLRSSAVDGVFDGSTAASVMIYKNLVMNEKKPDITVTPEMIRYLTATVDSYRDSYVTVDSQMEVAQLYLVNPSRGKRLAAEYISAKKKYDQMIEEEREAAARAYRELREKEISGEEPAA